MPMRPRSGRAFEIRQRKSWSSSSDEGLPERDDLDALRIHAGHDVLDRAVLAGRVHRLEDDEERVRVARPEQLLRLRELLDPASQDRLRLGLQLLARQRLEVRAAGPARIPVSECRRGTRLDQQLLEYPLCFSSRDLLCRDAEPGPHRAAPRDGRRACPARRTRGRRSGRAGRFPTASSSARPCRRSAAGAGAR